MKIYLYMHTPFNFTDLAMYCGELERLGNLEDPYL